MKPNDNSSFLRLAAAGLALAAAAPAPAQTVVSPADRLTLEGSSSTVYPLGRAHARVQQLLGDLPGQSLTFRGHAYRRDAITVRGVVGAFRSQLSVLVSLSPRTPATASATFDQNHGTAQNVLSQAWISFPQTDRPAGDPAPSFELRIPWAAPYVFAGPGTLCLETVVHGNDVGGLPDRNFSVYHDAHDLSRTASRQPGFRFGQGCAAPGSTTRAYANLELVATTTGLDLEVSARGGVATTASGPALSVLMLGTSAIAWPWPGRSECTLFVAPLVAQVLGSNDGSGGLDVTLRGVGGAPPGRTLLAQVLSVQPATLAGTLSDGSRLTFPTPPPAQLLHARVANGDDASATTGTVSFSVPVVELY